MQNSIQVQPRLFSSRKAVCLVTAAALLGLSGCSGVAPSRTASGAGTGAVIGGLGGAAVGSNSSMGTTTGALGGIAAGALVGGVVGMIQDSRDRKEQDRLAQERAYQQEMAKKKQDEARQKAEIDEELNIAQGLRITDIELEDQRKKFEAAAEQLKQVEAKLAGALARKKELDELREKTLASQAKTAEREEQLKRLSGEDLNVPPPTTPPPSAAMPAK